MGVLVVGDGDGEGDGDGVGVGVGVGDGAGAGAGAGACAGAGAGAGAGAEAGAEQGRAEQSRAGQSRAEQSRAEQSRAEQSRAEQSSFLTFPDSNSGWEKSCGILVCRWSAISKKESPPPSLGQASSEHSLGSHYKGYNGYIPISFLPAVVGKVGK